VYIPPYAFHWTTVLEVPRSGVGVRTGVMEHEAVPFAYEPPRIEERTPDRAAVDRPRCVERPSRERTMTDEHANPEAYEAPAIDARHEIGAPLVGGAASILPPSPPPT
jgi:hypothetical protein